MCTVAFLPAPDGGYVVGHNRDESVRRAAGLPAERHEREGRLFLAPRDPEGGGTWIGVNDAGVTLCLLNAFEPEPSRLAPEPPSRGRVLWDLLHLGGAADVERELSADRTRLREVRAFHLVVAERGGAPPRRARSMRIRWDGRDLSLDEHEGPRMYVSSSIDQPGVERERGRAWRRWLARAGTVGAMGLASWLAGHDPSRGPLSVCMHRPEARTVSRTLVAVGPRRVEMAYHDGSPCDASARTHVVSLE